MKVVGVIPARLAATRLPNKPLLDIGGKPMIQRVWERARQAKGVEDVIVATPDVQIAEVVRGFGGRAMMTSDRHRSGTDRVAEVAESVPADIFVNIQGDEPLIEPSSIEKAIQPLLDDESVRMTSLMCRCPADDLDNAACVKVVRDGRSDALYFSRARIPFQRQPGAGVSVMQHVGLYAYRRDFLLAFAALPPTPLEMTESLEQLRALEHGFKIRLVEIDSAPLSVDTPEDLKRILVLADNAGK
jgi:3-deoxy-manno-octulosonate cytidylyltransferase (CMP-KDO synthetase)